MSECRQLAQSLGVVVKEENIIRESGSAKASGIRPQFRRMLDKISKGELDGIITWHPDRLTRNMLEAGEIIDMLDNYILKDLKFVSHSFTNDPAGKMLLGILFVMAKQYSEKMSIDIRRGNDKTALEGKKVGAPNHGYIKDVNGRLRPDGNNFAIIDEAFRRKLRGDTLESIAEYLRSSGYTARGKDNKEVKIKIVVSTLGTIFSNPVYTGVMKRGKELVNLIELYDFIPMVTVEEFLRINKYKSLEQAFKTKKSKRSEKVKKADLLTGSVLCSECGEAMQAGVSKGKTKHYYYFRCETEDCKRHYKGTRAKVIVDFAKDFLAKKPFTSKKAYSSYKQEIIKIQNEGLQEIISQLTSLKRNLGLHADNIGDIKSRLAIEDDEEVKSIQKAELKKLEKLVLERQTLYEELLSKKEKVNKAPLSFEEFTQIMEVIPAKLDKVQSSTEINSILSKIYLNFTVDAKNVVNYTLKQPFEGLFNEKLSIGGGAAKLLE